MTVQAELILTLRGRLESGEFPDQRRLPNERDLARELKVSRNTLRRALGVLEAEGRLWRHVGKGTFAGARSDLDAPALAQLAHRTQPDEVMEVRLTLEPEIASLAARRATPADIAAMTRCLDKSTAAADIATFELWDGAFHRAIAQGAHNALLMALFDAVNAIRQEEVWGRLKRASLTPARKAHYCDQHRDCLAAIRDRDAHQAAQLMRHHLDVVRANLNDATSAPQREAAGV